MQDFTPDPPQLSFSFDESPPARDLAAERRAKHADYMREYTRANNERINAQRRARRTEETLERERAWRDANREKAREYKRQYSERYPEKDRERRRRYNQEHREEHNARARRYYWADVETTRAKDRADRKKRHAEELERERAYREARRETFRDYAREYYHRTKEERYHLILQNSQARRARTRGCKVTPVQLEAVLVRDCGICGICGKPVPAEELSFDHIIPLSKDGPHSPDNLQVAHIGCNKSKGAKMPTRSVE